MSRLLKLINKLLPSNQSPYGRDEVYLAQAVDIYDLERRMREIDERGRGMWPSLPFMVGLR
jgi:hypothetical protein